MNERSESRMYEVIGNFIVDHEFRRKLLEDPRKAMSEIFKDELSEMEIRAMVEPLNQLKEEDINSIKMLHDVLLNVRGPWPCGIMDKPCCFQGPGGAKEPEDTMEE